MHEGSKICVKLPNKSLVPFSHVVKRFCIVYECIFGGLRQGQFFLKQNMDLKNKVKNQ